MDAWRRGPWLRGMRDVDAWDAWDAVVLWSWCVEAWIRGMRGMPGCVEWMRGMFTQNTKLNTLAQSFEFSFSPAKQTLKCFPNLTSGRVGIGAIRGMIRKVG